MFFFNENTVIDKEQMWQTRLYIKVSDYRYKTEKLVKFSSLLS
jgi:hypothetical protein